MYKGDVRKDAVARRAEVEESKGAVITPPCGATFAQRKALMAASPQAGKLA